MEYWSTGVLEYWSDEKLHDAVEVLGLSLPRRRESRAFQKAWIPAFAEILETQFILRLG